MHFLAKKIYLTYKNIEVRLGDYEFMELKVDDFVKNIKDRT